SAIARRATTHKPFRIWLTFKFAWLLPNLLRFGWFLQNRPEDRPVFATPTSSRLRPIRPPDPDGSAHHILATRPAHKRARLPAFAFFETYSSSGSRDASVFDRRRAI